MLRLQSSSKDHIILHFRAGASIQLFPKDSDLNYTNAKQAYLITETGGLNLHTLPFKRQDWATNKNKLAGYWPIVSDVSKFQFESTMHQLINMGKIEKKIYYIPTRNHKIAYIEDHQYLLNDIFY